jgi:hypothetical protein
MVNKNKRNEAQRASKSIHNIETQKLELIQRATSIAARKIEDF